MIPILTTVPVDTTAREGEAVTITCHATGIPTPRIQWFIRASLVGEGDILNFTSVTASNAASYTCVASNEAGIRVSDSAELIILVRNNRGK